ncbi:MAG: peptidoglycan endopeptidase [Treponema sp.]|jgi:hypothetical protein|nr:peptidoglycan endopeptidase [Treponema sp.]
MRLSAFGRPGAALAGGALCALLIFPVQAAAGPPGSQESGQQAAGQQAAAQQAAAAKKRDYLSAFSDPARLWGNGVEALIEKTYRKSFKTRIIGGRVMNLRMPFAENFERLELSEQDWEILGKGKADPVFLWAEAEELLGTEDFARYTAVLGDGREKVVILDIPSQTWSVSLDFFDIARMKAGSYRGLPHRPYILVSGKGIEEKDVYNYLYCVGRVGMDCSGFVWNILSSVAAAAGTDLGRTLRRSVGAPRNGNPSFYAGTSFFNSRSREIIAVKDEIRNLKPADILLFRGEDGGAVHSAIIQSVNLMSGVIRYLQSTDEAPQRERGSHESFIYFDPASPKTRLSDPSVIWMQKRFSPFPGELAPPFSDDGERYRAYQEFGGGRVVRLRVIDEAVKKLARR